MSDLSVDELLEGMCSSLSTVCSSVDSLLKETENSDIPAIIQDIMDKTGTKKIEGVSLLSLKNDTLAGYLNNLVLIILAHIQRAVGQSSSDHIEKNRGIAVEESVRQRVSMEKGIKPLEKKLGYQLEKMMGSYNRMASSQDTMKSELTKKVIEGSDQESDDSSSDDEDELAYRPDAKSLVNTMSKNQDKRSKPEDRKENDVYRPPKISAVAPPTKVFDENSKDAKSNTRKLQSMEEFVKENSDLPSTEASIGSTIVDNGRGGVKTHFDRQKEREIQTYEESNFTRLPQSQNKKTFKQKQQDRLNNFAGENWSIFNNSRDMNESTSRKRKSKSVWDRVKRNKM